MNPVYRRTHFLLSAPDLAALPPDIDREVAFAGRSNAGKSSAINAITDQKGLARVSKTPGRTQQINVFPVTPGRVLIDLPGYGYAQVPAAVQARWQRVLPAYLSQRSALRGLMLIMDVRHPMTEFDRQMLDWCAHTELPVHVLLTKADKLRRGPALATLQRVRTALERGWPGHSVQLFSALRRSGIDEAHARLDQWLGLGGSDT